MRQLFFILSSYFIIAQYAIGQTTFPNNGAPNTMHTIYAFTNCTLHVDADATILNATLIIQDDKIIRVGEKLEVPKDAITLDLKGKHIYPAFVECLK